MVPLCSRYNENEESSRQLHEAPRRGRRGNREIEDALLEVRMPVEVRHGAGEDALPGLSVCRLHFICYFIMTALPNLKYTSDARIV